MHVQGAAALLLVPIPHALDVRDGRVSSEEPRFELLPPVVIVSRRLDGSRTMRQATARAW
eukprot:6940796-Prymnesium_polylepis.1